MDFTITCPNCGTELILFDSQVKRRRGTVRCTRCRCRVAYDLSQPRPVRIGFWAETETPFKPGDRDRLLSVIRARQKKAGVLPDTPEAPVTPRPRTDPARQSPFASFDLRTGQILPPGKPGKR